GVAASGDLVMEEIARRLARSHDVIAYCARAGDQQKSEQFDGVEYRRVSTWLDRRLLHRGKMMRLMDLFGWSGAAQPLIASALWYRHFIGEVGSDLSRQNCD